MRSKKPYSDHDRDSFIQCLADRVAKLEGDKSPKAEKAPKEPKKGKDAK
jgi:hypothetical protein